MTITSLPAGVFMPYGGSTAPTGWLLCDGSAVSRATYAALFAAIGTTYGVGNGTTTFNLPDARGRVVGGAGTGSGLTARTAGTTDGAETVTLSAAQSGVPAHSHGITDPGHAHGVYLAGTSETGGSSFVLRNVGTAQGPAYFDGFTNGKTTGITVNNATATAASASHTNVQPTLWASYIIKA